MKLQVIVPEKKALKYSEVQIGQVVESTSTGHFFVKSEKGLFNLDGNSINKFWPASRDSFTWSFYALEPGTRLILTVEEDGKL